MREFIKAGLRRFALGWFWAVVLLALPNCTFDASGGGVPPNLNPGDLPHSSAIMCDIERFQAPSRRCATDQDELMGIPLTMAAAALVAGKSSNIALDYSPDALDDCGGHPKAIDYEGPFPDGLPVCINCGAAIPSLHADATAVCVAQCLDLIQHNGAPAPPDIGAFCNANAHPSALFPANGCFDNACTEGGTLHDDFADPRRIPEPVVWTDFIGTSDAGSNLTRDAATTGNFDAGAVSTQWIHAGDGYVEFEASENNLSHVIGFAQLNGCAFPCNDGDAGITNIDFALSLNIDGRYYVLENGALVPGPDVNQSFGTYSAGERFRVHVVDKFDGNATIIYSRIVGPCLPGNSCNEQPIYAHPGIAAAYPLRVDTSFREQNATLANVNFVRIQ